ncbi:unnamed protein product [Ilex paraguariensis]|uniref:Uncharacterized protein n=1 Tax=Ilex paraguariensis TaxID=185542 RepID=A0ABC8RPB7_9AQUA
MVAQVDDSGKSINGKRKPELREQWQESKNEKMKTSRGFEILASVNIDPGFCSVWTALLQRSKNKSCRLQKKSYP